MEFCFESSSIIAGLPDSNQFYYGGEVAIAVIAFVLLKNKLATGNKYLELN